MRNGWLMGITEIETKIISDRINPLWLSKRPTQLQNALASTKLRRELISPDCWAPLQCWSIFLSQMLKSARARAFLWDSGCNEGKKANNRRLGHRSNQPAPSTPSPSVKLELRKRTVWLLGLRADQHSIPLTIFLRLWWAFFQAESSRVSHASIEASSLCIEVGCLPTLESVVAVFAVMDNR